MDQAASTLDLVTRQELYEKVEARVQDDAPFINLYYGHPYGPHVTYYDSAVYVQSADVLGLVIPPWGLDAVQMEKVQFLGYWTFYLPVVLRGDSSGP